MSSTVNLCFTSSLRDSLSRIWAFLMLTMFLLSVLHFVLIEGEKKKKVLFLLLPRAPSTPWTPCISPAPWSRRGSARCLPKLSHFQVGWEQPGAGQWLQCSGQGTAPCHTGQGTLHSVLHTQLRGAEQGQELEEHSHQPAPGSEEKLMCFACSQLLACISNTLFNNETIIFSKCFLAKNCIFFFKCHLCLIKKGPR